MAVPQAGLDNLPKKFVNDTSMTLTELFDLGRVSGDDETEQRIKAYIDICTRDGIRPGIEGLCLSLGITRMTLMRWARGENCSPRKQELITKARQYIASFLEQILLSGRGSVVGAIFASKNWLGYRDSVDVEISNRQPKAELTPEQILEQIEKDIPLDGIEDYTSDVQDVF